MRRPPPTRGQIRRRRRIALALLGLAAAAVAYLILSATVLAPADTRGARVASLVIHSRVLGGDQEVGVVVPAGADRGRRPLLVFLHGRNESVDTYTEDEAFFEALAGLGSRAPIVAFPAGSADSYWHDRSEGEWGTFVLDEVIPQVARSFGADPRRVAIGGVSMGGFGAYDLALLHPGRFCAVGGHSPALWLRGADTAAGAFDDAEDFERNDVIGMVRDNPAAFAGIPIWNDAGTDDPFLVSDRAFDGALRAAGAELSAHVWPGGHEHAYWDRHWAVYLRFYAKALAHCS
jgi:S-formylglutathione hydrolase FrmB